MKSNGTTRGQGIGCKRLFDYYFVVTCSDHGKQQTVRRLKTKSLAQAHDKDPMHAQFALRPKIVDRYPTKNYPDCALLPWVARASMPRGVRARTRPPPPKYFTFTGWNTDGHKLYGACLEVFEYIEIKNQKQPVYLPKTLGLLSHHPYFHAYEIFLKCLWHTIPKRIIPIEDLILHYFYDIPAPPVSKKLAYNLGSFKLYLGARNEFDIPIKELPIEVPFTQLSKDRMCTILKLLLLEKRVVFVCQFIPELTPVCELFSSLLFPLQWKHLFIPLVSKTVADALKDYQHPFLAGLPRFVYVRPEIHKNMPKDSYIVFLDRNEISDTNQNPIRVDTVPELPLSLEDNLQNAIHRLARILTMPYVSREITLQALRDMFAVITKLIFVTANPQLFEIDNDSGNDFCAAFRKTHLFSSFINYYKRVNPKDQMAKDVYPFYKSNEALGKHFARRSHTISWSRGFDEKQYHEKDKFRVNKDVIERGATMKKRPEPWPNGKRFVDAPEFSWTRAAQEFHKSYVFVPETGDKKSRTRAHRRGKSVKMKKGGKTKHSGTGAQLYPINEQGGPGTKGGVDANGNSRNGNRKGDGSSGGNEMKNDSRHRMHRHQNLNDEQRSKREKEFRTESLAFLRDMKAYPNLNDRVVRAREFEKWFKSDDDKKYFMNVLLEDQVSVNILMAMSRELNDNVKEQIRRTFKVTRYVDHKLRKAAKLQKKNLTNPGATGAPSQLIASTSDASLQLYSPRSDASDTNLLSDVDSGGATPRSGYSTSNNKSNQNNTEILQKPGISQNSGVGSGSTGKNRRGGGKDSNTLNKPKPNGSKFNNDKNIKNGSAFGKAVKTANGKPNNSQQQGTNNSSNNTSTNANKKYIGVGIGDSPESMDGNSPNFLSDMSDDDDDERLRQKRKANNGNTKTKANGNGNKKQAQSDTSDSGPSDSESESETDESGSETDSSAETTDSSYESWGSDTTISVHHKEQNRRESVASVRQGEKFVHLNEFELKPRERKIMQESQKRHSELLRGAEPEVIVATDLFSKSVLTEWQQFQSHSTRAGTGAKKRSRRNVNSKS